MAIAPRTMTTRGDNSAPLLVAGFLRTLVHQNAVDSVAYASSAQGISERPINITISFSTTCSVTVDSHIVLRNLVRSSTESTQTIPLACTPPGFVSMSGVWVREAGILRLPVLANTVPNQTYSCIVTLNRPLQAQPPPTLTLEVNGTDISRIEPGGLGGDERPFGLSVWCVPYPEPANAIVNPTGNVMSPAHVTVRCDRGYVLLVDSVRQDFVRVACKSDGRWNTTSSISCKKITGSLFSWGRNSKGQLGDGTLEPKFSPTLLALKDVSHVVGGESHSIAVTSNGSLYSWGSNGDGQLGYDVLSLNYTEAAQKFSSPNRTGMPSAANFSAYLNENGLTDNGGANVDTDYDGVISLQEFLALRTIQRIPRKVPFNGAVNIRTASVGRDFSVALDVDGGVWSWGAGNLGQIGHGLAAAVVDLPTQPSLSSGTTVAEICAGSGHVIARVGNDRIYAWGSNSKGQVGDGTRDNRLSPVLVLQSCSGLDSCSGPANEIFVRVVAGAFHSMALCKSGRVLSWGENYLGQLGDGSNADRSQPGYVKHLKGNVVQLFSGSGAFHSLALLENGEVQAWGGGSKGQLGVGGLAPQNYPTTVAGLSGTLASAALGREHSLGVSGPNQALQVWGTNTYGQLASETTATQITSPLSHSTQGVLLVEAGWFHSFAIWSAS